MNSLLLFAGIGRDIQVESLLIALAIMAGLAIVLGALIVLISKLCEVKEDPRIGEVTELLAGANCGGCGYPGCSGYAKALVEGGADLSACGQTCAANKAKIGEIIGQAVDANEEPTIAIVGCNGGNNAKVKCEVVGYDDCQSLSGVTGGKLLCSEGCLGGDTCEKSCPYNSIHVKNGVAKVDVDLCRSCGVCIGKCPKKIIHRIPKSAKIYIACSSHCRGKDVMNACANGCIGCGLCAKNCPNGAITMVDNLPVVDYSKCTGCGTCVEKCPRHAIKYVNENK